MKAVVVHQYGGPEVLKFEDYADPVPGAGEVLVRVAAASVNPVDYKRRAGLTEDFYPIHFPGLIGVDMAGTVVKIGPEVEGFSVGDSVFSMADNVLRAPPNAAQYPDVKVAPVFSKFDRKTLEFMAEAVRDGRLVIPIRETLPLRQAAEAQAAAEKGGAGKILLVA